MNQSQLVLDQVRAMGLILRDARLARDINPRDLETELRTTYRHLLAIEEGQMRLFYSDSFFCDLFTRYATQLGFSAEQAHDMRLALSGEGPLVASEAEEVEEVEPQSNSQPEASPEPQSEPTPEPDPKPESSLALELEPEPQSDPSPEQEAKREAQEPEPAAMQEAQEPAPMRSSDTSQSLGSLWFWGAIAIGLVLAVVILTLEPSADSPAPAAVKQPQAVVKSQEKEKTPPPPEPSPASTQAATAPPSPATVPNGSTETAEQAQTEAVAAPAAEPPRERRISDSILISAFEAPASFATGSAMAIRFNVKGWVWVREFDDNVREFVVQQGQTVRFNELPIFIVVPFPDQHTVTVSNQSVTLRRNDDEKNHARYSRSMLRGLVNNP